MLLAKPIEPIEFASADSSMTARRRGNKGVGRAHAVSARILTGLMAELRAWASACLCEGAISMCDAAKLLSCATPNTGGAKQPNLLPVAQEASAITRRKAIHEDPR